MKENNKSIAERTLRIIRDGNYVVENKTVHIDEQIKKCVDNTFTLAPDAFEAFTLPDKHYSGTEIIFKNATTIEALLEEKQGLKTGLLNFASAKNPGGGFLGGASAQEESLARSSSLHASLIKDPTMYAFNKSQSTYLYSDYMIYSPDVVFWMNDEGVLLQQPVLADVLTSPAPNKGAALQHHRTEQLEMLESVFKVRMEKMLLLAASQEIECLILGAWGCGVFRNDPDKVAGYFQELLAGKFAGRFKRIVFAVYDRSKTQACYRAFRDAFALVG